MTDELFPFAAFAWGLVFFVIGFLIRDYQLIGALITGVGVVLIIIAVITAFTNQ